MTLSLSWDGMRPFEKWLYALLLSFSLAASLKCAMPLLCLAPLGPFTCSLLCVLAFLDHHYYLLLLCLLISSLLFLTAISIREHRIVFAAMSLVFMVFDFSYALVETIRHIVNVSLHVPALSLIVIYAIPTLLSLALAVSLLIYLVSCFKERRARNASAGKESVLRECDDHGA